MSKKKRENLIEKTFDKKADIITHDKTEYHIRKVRIYNVKTGYYGKVYIITSPKYNKNNLHVIQEFYHTNQTDRIHVRLCRLTNVKMTKSIEKLPDGKERKILLINQFDESSEFIHSIGPIKEFKSDKVNYEKNHFLDINNNKILKLIVEGRVDNKKVA